MEIKVEVGQIWCNKEINEFKIVITRTTNMYADGVSARGMTINEKLKFIEDYFSLITDKYAGDWISAIASPEFKGEI